jgi:hypothetical protein
VRPTFIALLLMLVGGCQKPLHVYESKKPAFAVSTNANGAISLNSKPVTSDILLVTGAVQRVNLPLLSSPFIAGDKASCAIGVPARAIPAHPEVSKVVLHYDNHGWLQGLTRGSQIVLRFNKSGEFDGVVVDSALVGSPNQKKPQ